MHFIHRFTTTSNKRYRLAAKVSGRKNELDQEVVS